MVHSLYLSIWTTDEGALKTKKSTKTEEVNRLQQYVAKLTTGLYPAIIFEKKTTTLRKFSYASIIESMIASQINLYFYSTEIVKSVECSK